MQIKELLNVFDLSNIFSITINGLFVTKSKALSIYGNREVHQVYVDVSNESLVESLVETYIYVESDMESLRDYVSTSVKLPYNSSYINIKLRITIN